MTVAELIAALSALPPDLPVVVSDEGDFHDDARLSFIAIELEANTARAWGEGPHVKVDPEDGMPEGAVPALLIDYRGSHPPKRWPTLETLRAWMARGGGWAVMP